MSEKVTKSETAQDKPAPSKAERDAASSTGGGRKAVEENKLAGNQQEISPPVGLDMETRGDEAWSEDESSDEAESTTSENDQDVDDEDIPNADKEGT